eukprot:767802-Pelagomonas_calceolata.AAC.3
MHGVCRAHMQVAVCGKAEQQVCVCVCVCARACQACSGAKRHVCQLRLDGSNDECIRQLCAREQNKMGLSAHVLHRLKSHHLCTDLTKHILD